MITSLESLPLYASREEWAVALNISYDTIKQADLGDRLEGDLQHKKKSYTRKQILKWFAPSLYNEIYGTETFPYEVTTR